MISLHRAADRHVQLVDLALPVRVLDLPHPLLADDVDLHRVRRAARYRSKNSSAPQTNITIVMHERDDRPVSSSASEPWIVGADLVVVPAAVLDREDDDERRDEQREERA